MAINFEKAKEKYGGSSNISTTKSSGIDFSGAKTKYSSTMSPLASLASPYTEMPKGRADIQRERELSLRLKPTMAETLLGGKRFERPDYESMLAEREVTTPKESLRELGANIKSGDIFKSIGRLVTDKEMQKEIKPQSTLKSFIEGTDRTKTEKALDLTKSFQEQPFAAGLFEGALPGSQVARAEKTLGEQYGLNPFELAKETSPVAYTAGDIAGTLAKFMAAAKTVEPLVGKIGFLKPIEGANKLTNYAKALGRIGLVNTMIDIPLIATDAIQEGKSAKEVAKEVGIELAIDTAFDSLLMGLGDVIKTRKGKKALQSVKNIAEETPTSPIDEIVPPKGIADDAIRAKQIDIEDLLNETMTYGTDRTKELNAAYKDLQVLMAKNDLDSLKSYRENIKTIRDELVNAEDVMLKMERITSLNQKLDQLDDVISKAEALEIDEGTGLIETLVGEPPRATITPASESVQRAATTSNLSKTPMETTVSQIQDTSAAAPTAATMPKTGKPIPPFNPELGQTGQTRLRQFIENTFKSSENVPDYVKTLAPSSSYDRISTDKMLNLAVEAVTKDPVTARMYWDNIEGITSAQDTAIGEALILKYLKEGNLEGVNKIASDLAIAATNAGQANAQIIAFKKMTPEGMIMHAQRVIDNYNKKAVARWGNKAKKIELTPEDTKKIAEHMHAYAKSNGSRKQQAELYKATRVIADKLPVAPAEKLKAFLRISMLLNPKTQIRNVGGNILLQSLETFKDIPASAADVVAKAFTGKRTVTPGFNALSWTRGFKEGVSDFMLDVIEKVDTSMDATKWELPKGKVFNNRVLNALDQTTTRLLQAGDRPFYQAAYKQRLDELRKLNKVDTPTREMIQDATQTALERTYQDVNEYTKAVEGIRKALNNFGSALGLGTQNFGIGNLILPFSKTPANILRKAVQYSPLELLDLTAKAISKGKVGQKYFVENIGRMITGSGIIYLGYKMTKDGDMKASLDESEKVRDLQYQKGEMPYSMKIGDKWVTFDALEPIAIPLAVGGELAQAGFDEQTVLEALEKGLNTFFNKSFLQGISRMMSGYSPAAGIVESLTGSTSQAVPTLFGQVADFMDTYYRDISAEGNLEKTLKALQKKMPGLRENLPAKIDLLGNPIETYPASRGKATYPLDVFFNPVRVSEPTTNLAWLELIELFDATKDTGHLPQMAPNSLKLPGTDQTHKLTADEKRQFMEIQGDYATELILQLISNPEYMEYDPATRQEILEDRMRDVKSAARNDILRILIGGSQ